MIKPEAKMISSDFGRDARILPPARVSLEFWPAKDGSQEGKGRVNELTVRGEAQTVLA
jgi:hypothetical protein